MILKAEFDGGGLPFEGERDLALRALPVAARVVAARATINPIDASGGLDPFVEEIRFPGGQGNQTGSGALGDWGATQSRGPGFVEIDFHARRTLAGLTGSDLAGARLLVDVGGTFVAVDPAGGFARAGGPFFTLANHGPLPGVAASRLRIVHDGAGQFPAVSALRVRSLPTNVTFALAGRPAFFFQAGELGAARTTPDFGSLLAAYLAEGADVADGVYSLPFVLRSDALARLRVGIEIEYLRTATLLPADLPEAKLAYDLALEPRAGSTALEVALPAHARPVAEASTGRVEGPFAETRIAWPPVAELASLEPLGEALSLSSAGSAAQPLALPERAEGYEVVAIDLPLAAIDRKVELTLDLRSDDSGKPGADSLLAAPVPFELSRAAQGGERWLSVQLPRPRTLRSASERSCWVLLQSVEGQATWNVRAAAPDAVPLQASTDGGFSYRAATTPGSDPAASPLAGLLRLRESPEGFRLPLSARIGSGAEAEWVDLSRLSPLGKVAFDLSIPEISAGLSAALDRVPGEDLPARGELLTDGAFERWTVEGDEIGAPLSISASSSSAAALIECAPDGRTVFGLHTAGADGLQLIAWNTEVLTESWRLALGPLSTDRLDSPRALAVDPAGRFLYLLLHFRLVVVDLAARRVLGALDGVRDGSALAVSADGTELAIAGGSGWQHEHPTLAAYDSETLSDLIRRGESSIESAHLEMVQATGAPVDLAFSVDGERLFLLTSGLDSDEVDGGELAVYESGNLARTPPRTAFSGPPRALGLVSEGAAAERSILVLHDDRLARYDAVTSAPLEGTLAQTDGVALAVEPSGRRALLLDEGGLHAVSISPAGLRRVPVPPGIALGEALAVSPLGDRAVVLRRTAAGGTGSVLQVLPLGSPRPLDWTVTAGAVQPRSLSGGSLGGVVLGEISKPQFSNSTFDVFRPAGPSALSQVLAASAGRTYELSFLGEAQTAARAEVLWRSAAGETIEIASLAIEQGRRRASEDLFRHRGRFLAPEETFAAEVRFVSEGGVAQIREASFREPENVLARGDLLGAAEVWEPRPAVAPGFRIAATGGGSRVGNAGSAPVVLRQRVPVAPGAPFELALRARLEGGAAAVAGLQFLAADQSPLGAPVALEVHPDSFDTAVAQGFVPADAGSAEVTFTTPGGTTVVLQAIELRVQPRVNLPLTFMAEAPGELTVLGGEIAWDFAEVRPRPRFEDLALPEPTPPPGAPGGDDDCDPHEAVAPGLPAPLISPQSSPIEPIEIRGIGPRRAALLRERGITNLEGLLTTNPRELTRILPTVSDRMARDFLRQARDLLDP